MFNVAEILPRIPFILAYLAGLIVAIILAARYKSRAAILALVGFAVLFVMSLVGFGRAPLVAALARRAGPRGMVTAATGVNCCCGAIDVLALVCLIVALWQAVSGAGRKGKAPRPEASEEPLPQTPTVGTSGD